MNSITNYLTNQKRISSRNSDKKVAPPVRKRSKLSHVEDVDSIVTDANNHNEHKENITINQAPQLVSTAAIVLKAPAEPAYKRFAHLVNPISPVVKRPLPQHFEKLGALFDSLETVLSFLQSRGETAVYHKIKRSVEQQARL